MNPSDALIASYCASIYSPTAIIGDWDRFDPGLDDGVCYGIKKLRGFDLVVFRGSVTPQDWIADFRAIPIPTRIGHVHAGFFAGMEHVWSELRPLLMQPVIVAGHSLGAARAAVLCALMVKDGVMPAGRVVFGEPKPGFLDLAELIKAVPARSYRNGDDLHHDLVTDVPFSLPPFQFVHPTPIVPVFAEPTGDLFNRYGAFAWHAITLYQAALAAHPEETAA